MSDRTDIEELIRSKLEDAEITPSRGVWKGVQRQLRMKRFLRFDPGQFNLFYLGAILIAAAALFTLVSRNTEGPASPEPVREPYQVSRERVTETENRAGDQDPERGRETPERDRVSENNAKALRESGAATPGKASGKDESGTADAAEGTAGDPLPSGSGSEPQQPVRQTLVTYFTASAYSGCAPLRVQFFNSSANAGTVTWSFGTGETSSEENPEYKYTEPGKYFVTLRTEGEDGQSGTHLQWIEVYGSPVAGFDFEEGLDGVDGAPTLNLVNYSSGASSYAWDIADNGASPANRWSSIEYQPVLSISGRQSAGRSVRLVVMNEYGCSDTAVSRIPAVSGTDRPWLRFPTAFSPSMTGPTGGSYNPNERRIDIFHPIISEEPAEYHLQIFSRLGELVYETHEIYRGWDGYHLQQRSAGGVYLWIAEGSWEDGSSFNMKGDVTLIWDDR
jgi:hypothetical protein